MQLKRLTDPFCRKQHGHIGGQASYSTIGDHFKYKDKQAHLE